MTQPLSVVFFWHMHQPFYREAESGHYQLPWVYLHAIKGYTDMAEILDQVPGARAVVNYVPSLTAQIEDYAVQIRRWQSREANSLPDPLLEALVHAQADFDAASRDLLLDSCFRLNLERNMHRYAHYTRLWKLAEHAARQDAEDYLGANYFTDLVTWYHLGWLGESVRQKNFVAQRLIDKGRDFSLQDRQELLGLIGSLLSELPGRYRKLEAEGKIELSTTPYAHPILPLLLDFNVARETVHDALIPEQNYPGGEARAIDHIERAITAHESVFGSMARGVWPAEGGVSDAALRLLGRHGFTWCATGEAVLHHSLGRNLREHNQHREMYEPWRFGGEEEEITCFFRDDHLSDLIGFVYAKWHTDDAIANFMHELAGIRHRTQGMEAPVVSIVMDGENAWEHYHENGLPFLTSLYQTITEHPEYELTTYSDYLGRHPATSRLEHLVPGSWVYGNFSTWIGDAAKTRGWELLVHAKTAYDAALAAGGLDADQLAAAEEQLRICEGSDWCWWFGDYNPGSAVRDFDALYRQHLKKLYQLIGVEPPAELDEVISEGGGDAEGGGTMRRNR